MGHEGFCLEVEIDSLGQKQYFYCHEDYLKKGDYVVVETSFGLELAKVIKEPKKESESAVFSTNQIVRVATKEDIKYAQLNKTSAFEAGEIFSENVKKLKIPLDICRRHVIMTKLSDSNNMGV